MAGRSSLSATEVQKVALELLARSDIRGKADRARAILLRSRDWRPCDLTRPPGHAARHERTAQPWLRNDNRDTCSCRQYNTARNEPIWHTTREAFAVSLLDRDKR